VFIITLLTLWTFQHPTKPFNDTGLWTEILYRVSGE
jgi:hypothetical protein